MENKIYTKAERRRSTLPAHVGGWILRHGMYVRVEVINSKEHFVEEEPRHVKHSYRKVLRNDENTHGGRFYTFLRVEVLWIV